MRDPALFEEVQEFFHRHTNRSFNEHNMLFQARLDGELIGLVRLCHEENRFILRSMEIKKEHQRKRIGTRLLQSFDEYLRAREISLCYCLPYDHLVSFYSQIGFRTVEVEAELPTFLRLRLEAYRRKRPEARFLGMVRP